MAQFAVDAFGGTADTELSAYNAAWSKQTGFSINHIITAAGRTRTSDGFNVSAYQHSGSPATADYSAKCDLYKLNTTAYYSGPMVRASTSAATFYMARNAVAANVQLFKCIAGTYTQLGGDVAATLALDVNTNIKLECVGTALKIYWDNSSTASISQTDGDITAAGKSGIWVYSGVGEGNFTGVHIDNFSGDDAGSAGTTFTRALTAVSTSSSSLTKALTVLKTVNAVSVASAVVNKAAQLLKTITAVSSSVATAIKSISTTKTATSVSIASMTVLKVVLRALSTVSTAVASRVLQVRFVLSTSSVTIASMNRILSLSKQLTAVSTSVSSALRQLSRQLATTVTNSATMIVLKASLRTLTATSGSVASVATGIQKTLSVISTSIATNVRQIRFTLSASIANAASVSRGAVRYISLAIVSPTIATLVATYISASSMIRNIVAVTMTFTRTRLTTGLFQRKKTTDAEF